MTNKTKSLIGGISILSIAGLISKMIGVLYKIPLAKTIGSLGMGVYHQVFPTYNLLLTISSVGIPVAISRMVAARLANDDRKNAKRVFNVSLVLLTILGFIGSAVLFIFSDDLARAKATETCTQSYVAIAPSLFLVCVMSAFRGFMQGRRRMVPTAISQLIEQVGKVVIAMPIAAYGMRNDDYALGAAGAMLGVSLAEALALLYMFIDERLTNKSYMFEKQAEAPIESSKSIAKEILKISLPITIGACIVPIASEIDSLMLVRLMSGYLSKSEALINYGTYTGLVFPLINVPTAIAMATAINLVPAISSALAKNDFKRIAKESSAGLRFASIIGFPSSIGLSLLAEPVIFTLFSGDKYTAAQLAKGADLLRISALTIILFTQVQATSGILQGLNKQRIPMYTLIAGVLVKIAVNYTLIKIPEINIHGAPFASILCYSVSLIPNLYYIKKHANFNINLGELIFRPLAATGFMAIVLVLFRQVAGQRLNSSWTLLGTAIFLAAVAFAFGASMFKAVRKRDVPHRFRRFFHE